MTTVDMANKYQREYAQVVTLKGHLKMIKVGMSPRPPLTKTKLMDQARILTGATFSNREYNVAIKALEARRDALLVYIQHDG